MRVVLDTNVIVSAVLGGASRAILELWRQGRFTLILTNDVLREYDMVLRRPKFGLSVAVVDGIIDDLFREAEFAVVTRRVTVVEADPGDNMFLEAALAGNAVCLVSGGKHLLALKNCQGVAIHTPRDFLGRMETEARDGK